MQTFYRKAWNSYLLDFSAIYPPNLAQQTSTISGDNKLSCKICAMPDLVLYYLWAQNVFLTFFKLSGINIICGLKMWLFLKNTLLDKTQYIQQWKVIKFIFGDKAKPFGRKGLLHFIRQHTFCLKSKVIWAHLSDKYYFHTKDIKYIFITNLFWF